MLAWLDKKSDAAHPAEPSFARVGGFAAGALGIDIVMSRTSLAGRPEEDALSGNLVAVAPLNRDSGTVRCPCRVWGGSAPIPVALPMDTLVARKCNPVIRDFYRRLQWLPSSRLRGVAIALSMPWA